MQRSCCLLGFQLCGTGGADELGYDSGCFADTQYGQLALEKLAPVPENFRLFEAGWLGKRPEDWRVMCVKGAEFRVAKTGPRKGTLSIMVKGTERSVCLTREEIAAAGADNTV